MLEKIGLPAKPSMRGNTWVVDASNCQGCSSQFTFINRKHHCRRCGGIFCSSCTQQRMVLRGQGDSAVRICDPCKKLEEAARFEMRHGHKNKTGRGGSKQTSKDEDDVLKHILGADRKQSLSGKGPISNMVSDLDRGTSNASCSNFDESLSQDGKGAVDTRNATSEGIASSSPEELRQQALEEKKKHKILKGEGKPEEALKAFKRGKELEREAKALEVALRKSQRKALSSSGSSSIHTVNADPEESGRKGKVSSQMHREGKDDLAAELRELGWSDADLHDADKKPAKISLEGELSSIIGVVHTKPGASKQAGSINKTEVIALKKKALMFKREGKLGEAKEELKRAKVLEQKLEEQELLAGAEDSDDELSSLIHSMDDDKQDDLSLLYQQDAGFDFDHLLQDPDDFGLDGGFDVTDQDMDDPEMAAALNALGWTKELKHLDLTAGATAKQSVPMDGKALLDEALSLKKEAIRQKQSGNSEAAMTLLRKAKLLEKDAKSFQNSPRNSSVASQSAETSSLMEMDDGFVGPMKHVDAKLPGKCKLVLQKELLALKKKALALRREGRVDEAEEELKKGRVLECQLEGMESTLKVKAANVKVGRQVSESMYEKPNKSGEMGLGEEMDAEDVTDQDMHDPTLLSLLENLGWKDEEEKSESLSLKPAKSKLALQKELLGIKKKALALRREGRIDEAEEELKKGRVLECQLEEMDSTAKVRATTVKVGSQVSESIYEKPNKSGDMVLGEEVDAEDLTDEDMHDPALLLLLENLGWKDEEEKSESLPLRPSKQIGNNPDYPVDTSVVRSPETPLSAPKRSKAEIQRELLGLKRKAHTLRRQGEAEEAEEILRMAKVLEAQMAEIEAPKRELPPYTGSDEVSGLSKNFDHVGSGTSIPPRSSSNYDHGSSPAVADTRITEPGSSFYQADQLDLLTGGSWNRSELDREEKEKESTGENISSPSNLYIQPGSSNSPNKEIGSKNEMSYDRWGKTHSTIEKIPPHEANIDHISDFQSNPSNIQHEILVHKRRAVALKKEGKLAEAREELRRAKLLEKSPEKDAVLPDAGAVNTSSSASNETLTVQDDQKMAHQAPKAMTGRDRFKLQQKSLAHKRQALKLRREGKIEESEAEFQLAKALENQLEELAGNDPSNLNKTIDVTVENNNLGVEDLLDPQLLSALKAIGLQDAEVVPQVSSRSEDTKVSTGKVVTISPEKSELKIGLNDTLNQEKIQLEERIRAEKVKAVSLKRAGKQAEALDSLRRAKLYEKKLSSLA